MLSLDGLEMIAVLVVMGLFVKVLEQFGLFEVVGEEGNGRGVWGGGVSVLLLFLKLLYLIKFHTISIYFYLNYLHFIISRKYCKV